MIRSLSRRLLTLGACLCLLGAGFSQAAGVDRSVLPPDPPEFKGRIADDYKQSQPDWSPALPLQAPAGAPNVLIVVLDDAGYGQLGSYGGQIETPNMDRIAAQGIRYNDFHTTALCSPSRASLLTGRHHHALGMASITEAATGFPGQYGVMPKSAATIAEVLKQNGYNTMALGKWHLAPYTAYTAAGPFDRWPLGQGFEKFYGFIGGEVDQWAPLLAQDNQFIDIPGRPGYHLTEDLVDRTIAMIRDQQQASTGRPFFAYLALGAPHAPLHAPKAFIDKYKGRFDAGWDKAREEILARQKALGIVPKDTVLPERNPGIPAWDSLSAEQKQVYTRLQEVFAGFVDHADHHLGRLMAALDDMGIRDNTLVIVVSDNGASQEGLAHGSLNTDRYRNFFPEQPKEMLARLDEAGSATTDPHYPMGWGMAGNTPFKRWKQDTHNGGNTDPFIVSWPAKIKDGGSIRRQYHHLVDVVPTLLEVIGLPAPTSVNGVRQMPMHGVSMAYSLTDGAARTRKKVQHYEMFGSRAIWSEGWKAVAWHRKDTPFESDKWELYHTDVDFNETNDLAEKHPEKLAELKALFASEARKYGVLPLDDRRYERVLDPTRPNATIPKAEYVYYPGTSVVHPLAAPTMLGRDHDISAQIEIPAGGAEGVLAALGGEFGGWSLYLKDGRPHYAHNYLQVADYKLSSPKALGPGKHTVAVRVKAKERIPRPSHSINDVALLVDGEVVGELKDVKFAGQYSAITGYGLTIGRNIGTPVSHDYKVPFAFTGKLDKVTIRTAAGK